MIRNHFTTDGRACQAHSLAYPYAGDPGKDMAAFLDRLHSGGPFANWWHDIGKETSWFSTAKRTHPPLRWKGNVYFSVHPCAQIPTNKKHTRSSIKNIAAVNCFFAEFDVKDFGSKEAISAHVSTLPLQPSVIIDSGGGYHTYHLLAETVIVTDENREHIKALQYAWVDFVGSDQASKDLARVLRPVGTINRKEKYAPDFPTVSFVECDLDRSYALEDFERLTEQVRQEKPKHSNGVYKPLPSGAGTPYGLKALTNECNKVAAATAGVNRNKTLNDAAFAVATLAAGGEVNEGYARSELLSAALAVGLPEREAERTIKSGFDAGLKKPRNAPERPEYKETPQRRVDPATGEIAGCSNEDSLIALLNKINDAGEEAKRASIDGKMSAAVRGTLEGKINKLEDEIASHAKFAVMIASAINQAGYGFDAALLYVQTCILSAQIGKEKAKGYASLRFKVDKLRNMGHKFRLNLMEDNVEMDGKTIDDVSKSELYLYMDAHKINKSETDDCLNVLAREDSYHPIKDYLNGLVWDGENHLAKMLNHIKGDGRFIDYNNKRLVTMGETADHEKGIITKDDFARGGYAPLHWVIIRKWMLGCVARGLEGDKPTAFKFQTPMLVFVGGQGLGKSAWVRWLVSGVGFDYHRESPIDPHHPEHVRSAVTKWIWEASELGSSLRKTDREAIKGFLTQEWHTYRKPWGRGQITKPTLANFVGTINNETGFLDDPTGNRRYLPLNITHINHAYKDAVDIDQVWAQVVHLYKNGESPVLRDAEKAALGETMEEHEVENPLQGHVQRLFAANPDDDDSFTFTSDVIHELRKDGIALNPNNKHAGREIAEALAPMGLRRDKRSIDGVKGWGWIGLGRR